MKKSFHIGIFFAFCFIIVKMVADFAGIFEGQIKPFALFNLLLLLASVAIGLYLYFKRRTTRKEDIMKEIKEAMKAGVTYTTIVSAFLFIYYNNINTTFFENIKTEQIDALKEAVYDPETLATMRSGNATLQMMEPEEMIQVRTKQLDQFMSPKFMLIISLLGMMLMSILYSILVTIIYRSVLFRN